MPQEVWKSESVSDHHSIVLFFVVVPSRVLTLEACFFAFGSWFSHHHLAGQAIRLMVLGTLQTI